MTKKFWGLIEIYRAPIIVFFVVAWCYNEFEMSSLKVFVIFVITNIFLARSFANGLATALIGCCILGWLRDFIVPITTLNLFSYEWMNSGALAAFLSSFIATLAVHILSHTGTA